ncbi:ImmA/IrrE family metallo-endopeptidase [Bifidobacterium leontopitheci]|uniref:IrrE N-terminal-like domain-containing protein n=1 Tax=Bifidobacterium leontopitheci TaxID=2650774 RepID=A0A6I1GLK5_9BIFI|nr:ImmA/IrrE family metallo-endopeptidase [Bifidobacterium leontopitheci]KAB7790486.1 hypothetical protein F7D09_0982 [Bifidobacterium leontopitheci]
MAFETEMIGQWAAEQSDRMLEAARSSHPKTFEADCLSENCISRIASHWRGRLVVQKVERLSDSEGYTSDSAQVDEGGDLSGLYLPCKARADGRATLVVAYAFYRRMTFTLLHELGHYLQRERDDLRVELCLFTDRGEAKEAEETACNMFASKALLPDSLLEDTRDNNANARWAQRLYRHSRASRAVIVRRLAPLLEPGSWMMYYDTKDVPRLRAYWDGRVEYDVSTMPVERAALNTVGGGCSSYTCKVEDLVEDTDGLPTYVSAASSASGRFGTAKFVMVRN